MTTQDIIDHLKAGRPLTKNVAKEIIRELERVKALEMEVKRQGGTICGERRFSEALCNDLRAKLSEYEQRVKALEEALTPSAETKFAYMGEFEFPVLYVDENGDEVTYEEAVPWVTIKEIMKAIKQRAEAACQK